MFDARKRTYLDYAGATPVRREALKAYTKSALYYGNPGALHSEGVDAKASLEESRAAIARFFGCKASEIIFTSGGTEGNNLALIGTCNELERKEALQGARFIISSIEHPSVLEAAHHAAMRGADVVYCAPNRKGIITPEAVASLLTERTVFVSVGWANGEIGVVQPLSAIAKVIRAFELERGGEEQIIFHSDFGQAVLYLSPQVHTLGVDCATVDGGKLGSVRGAGVLFIKRGTPLSPLLFGGSQERGLRPGTEGVAHAASLASVLSSVAKEREHEAGRLTALRARCIQLIEAAPALTGSMVNGTGKAQLPNILNISVPNISNEYVVLALDTAGFAIATKSACREKERISHVVAGIAGADEEWRARSALRISFGRATRERDVRALVRSLSKIVERIRSQEQEKGNRPLS